MTHKAYQSGNTVRLEVLFKDFSGQPIDPDSVELLFYENGEVVNQISMNESNRLYEGFYVYLLVTDNTPKTITYEWKGIISGNPSLKRGTFRTVFLS